MRTNGTFSNHITHANFRKKYIKHVTYSNDIDNGFYTFHSLIRPFHVVVVYINLHRQNIN